MDDIYNDLENYDDVDAVNRLKAENSELKHKLEGCTRSMQKLQTSILQDFDKLEAEFKKLESSYSSLLKVSRAEIQRKTDMITNLNIEKDLLVIKAVQNGSAHKVQQLIRNVREETEFKHKKIRNKVGVPKVKEESIRRRSSRRASPATSSTATDISNKILGMERVTDNNKSSKMVTKENEVFSDHRGDGIRSPVADKRVSALARHHLGKLSSDEEFEDMYSALKPKTSREPVITRKRGRDDSQDGKVFNNSSQERPSNYPDSFRDRFNKNKAGRFSDNERNINKDKQHNESEKYINRGKKDRNRNTSDSHYQRFSPERHRRGAKDLVDDRYRNRRLESPPREKQRLESPPRERRRFGTPPRERHYNEIRERRKSFHVRDREHQRPEGLGHNYPETHSVIHNIHGDYGEPQNKRPRIEPYSHEEERRPIGKQYFEEPKPADMESRRSQSPDFSHTESSNEPVTASDIRSTDSPALEDPRTSSNLYVKSTEGNKEVLQSATANEICLQPVDKSLWNLGEVEVPKALRDKPAEISEELVNEMDIDKPLSIASLESGELGSETTDTALDDMYDFLEFNKQNYNSTINDRRKIKLRTHEEKSPFNNMEGDMENKNKTLKKETRTTRYKIPKVKKADNHRAGEPSLLTSKDSHRADTNTHRDKTQLPSILQKLMHSMDEKRPSSDQSVKLSNSKDEKETKGIAESRILNKTEKVGSRTRDDKESKHMSEINTTDKPENNKKELKRISESLLLDQTGKAVSKTRDEVKHINVSAMDKREKGIEHNNDKELKQVAKLGILDKAEKVSLKTIVEMDHNSVSELKNTNNPEKVTENNTDKESRRKVESKISDRNEKTSFKSSKTEHKNVIRSKIKNKAEKEAEKNVTIFREFEHRVYARHIVEGDLELSDESNDETQVKREEKTEVKKKITPGRKSHRETSKEKRVDSEDGRKTRSQDDKEKERKSINKFSELFGDSSSLITPEDLKLATRTAHGLPADCCPPAGEEAQDAIIEPESPSKTQPIKVTSKSDFIEGSGESSIIKTKEPKDNVTHTKHKQNKDLKSVLVSNDATQYKGTEDVFSEEKEHAAFSCESHSVSEGNLVLSNDRVKQLDNDKTTNGTNQNDVLQLSEKPKAPLKSNKRPKTKGEKKLSPREPAEDIDTNKVPNSNNILTMSDNKENSSGNDHTEGNISNEMAKIFEKPEVSSKIPSSDAIEVNKDLNESTKETTCSTVVEDVPNLAPVTEESGLVKMVVISTGVQPPDSSSVQYATPFNALASSTPAKDLSAINISSEIEPKADQSAQVSVTIAREDSISQSETDAPDMRITCYRRRRKVVRR